MTAPVSTSLVPVGAAEAAGAISERPALRILRPLAEPALLIEAQNRVREFVKSVLKENIDYGTIPGTDGKALLKPGAEKLTAGFGCVAVPRIIEQEVDHFREVPWTKRRKEWVTKNGRREQVFTETVGVSFGLYRYVLAVDIVDQDGVVRATGLGSCSSLESKYCDRPRDVENTVLKMARKRAHVAGALDAFGLSNEFNAVDDGEDGDEEEAGEAGAAPAPAKARGDEQGMFPIPFGWLKDRAVADVTAKELQGALDFNLQKFPTKYLDFQKEAKAELARRSARASKPEPETKPEPKSEPAAAAQPAPGFDAPLPPEPELDLPF